MCTPQEQCDREEDCPAWSPLEGIATRGSGRADTQTTCSVLCFLAKQGPLTVPLCLLFVTSHSLPLQQPHCDFYQEMRFKKALE